MRIAVTAALLATLAAGPAFAQAQPKPAPQAQSQEKIPAQPKKPAVKQAKPAKPVQPTLLQLAGQGDAQAQYQLALAYRDGKGMKKNPVEAASWLAIAAGNGIAAAAIDLAHAHEQGAGVSKDLNQAAQWWFRAGVLGDEAAKARFIDLFLTEQTDDIQGPTGAGWIEALAQAGNVSAMLAVGQAYEEGEGLPVDFAKAQHWYRLAALANDVDGKYHLGRMLLSEPGAWRLLYKDRSREAENTDRNRLYPSRAAALEAAGDEREPDVVRPGMVEGEQWLAEAARQGHAEAQYTLGQAYLGGMDLPFNMIEAVNWLSAAAWSGHAHSLLVLADLAAKGQGFAGKDPVRAWVNYEMAAAMGAKEAEEARDRLAKSMNPRQLTRARQVAQDLKGN